MIIKLLALVACLLLNAFFSASEIAIVRTSKVRIEQLIKGGHRGAETLLKLKNNPKKLFSTVQVGINSVSMGASALVAVITVQLFGSYLVAVGTAVLAFIVIVFGEVVPKNFAYAHAENIALSSAKLLDFFATILTPVTVSIDMMTRKMVKCDSYKRVITPEELLSYLAVSAEGGAVGRKEKEIIENVLNFKSVTAEDVMTPRVMMFTLNANLKVKDVVTDVISLPYSRIPLYEKTKDEIVGIIHIKSVFKLIKEKKINVKLKGLAEKPLFVPETILLVDLLKLFQEKKMHMAIVIDEFGGIRGLVTITDLIEELVGELVAETDVTKNIMMRVDKYTIIVDGSTNAGNINRFFNISLPGKNFETISKLILKKLKRLPKEGEMLVIGGLDVKVEKIDHNRIQRVKISKPATSP